MQQERAITYVDKKDPSVTFKDGFVRACSPEHKGEFLLVNAPVETVEKIAQRHGQTGVTFKSGTARRFS